MLKLSISNIGWIRESDFDVYELMKKYGYSGLEIAPTRVFPEKPYEKLSDARLWSGQLNKDYGFIIPSMQSIWYGRQERIFASKGERDILANYTKRAIDFASVIGCKNLVFGCPKNRNVMKNENTDVAISFFRELAEYALSHETVIGMEANPPIYNTNYINDTLSALELIRQVDSKGFLLNLDIGTMIQNQESLSDLIGQTKYINHIHISEPRLKPIKERELHQELRRLLLQENYQGFVSIEMGKMDDLNCLERVLKYVKGVFCI